MEKGRTMARGEADAWWKGKGFSSYTNRQCEYYPCHTVANGADFSCLFCYCPLYALGEQCGGQYSYLENGVKDCSACCLPHDPARYGDICDRLALLIEQQRKR